MIGRKAMVKKPENLDLISMYFAYHASGYRIDLRKVKGHNGTFWK